MTDEMFAVVNEHDEVVGRNTRKEVHRLGLLHRAVHILVFNKAGEVFLQKRSQTKDRHPGVWDSSSSGHVDFGEIYDQCAVREIMEEIGLQNASPARLFKLTASQRTDQEHVWVYKCNSEGPFSLHPHEIERGEWFTAEAVDKWLYDRPEAFSPAFRLVWETFRQGS